MTLALFSIADGGDRDDGLFGRLGDLASFDAGVRRASAFSRQTADVGTFAVAFGSERLVVVELDGNGYNVDGTIELVEHHLGARRQGTFEQISFSAGSRRVADLHAATGILVAMLNNTDPGRDEEFNRWYDDVHLADVTAAGGFAGATRYRALETGAHGAHYLAIYVSDRTDVAQQQLDVIAARGGMVIWPSISQVHSGAYKRIGA